MIRSPAMTLKQTVVGAAISALVSTALFWLLGKLLFENSYGIVGLVSFGVSMFVFWFVRYWFGVKVQPLDRRGIKLP